MSPSLTQNRRVLAADVGGTKTLLQFADVDAEGQHTALAEQRYQSNAFDSLEEMIERFVDESALGAPDSACLAVAGPVQQQGDTQTASLTNLPWQLNSSAMRERLAIPRLTLLNDFQAIGYSLDALAENDLVALQDKQAVKGATRLVVGAGTGLGVCNLFPDCGHYISYPSEGGHLAFSPADEQQLALLQFLQQEYARVSYERLLSGTGLVNIYRFLLHPQQQHDDPLLTAPDPAAAIGELAVAGNHPLAVEAVRLFSRIYGAFAGEQALSTLPAGGVFIAGGIAPKLLSYLQEGTFMENFLDKGRMGSLMHGFPVKVITNPRCGLLGAAHYAARL